MVLIMHKKVITIAPARKLLVMTIARRKNFKKIEKLSLKQLLFRKTDFGYIAFKNDAFKQMFQEHIFLKQMFLKQFLEGPG